MPKSQYHDFTLIQHPSAPVSFDPPPDPREQAVASPESVARAKAQTEAERAAIGGICIACGVSTKHHWSISGTWVGCDGATGQRGPYRDAERWNNPFTAETVALRRAMVGGTFGPRLEIHMPCYSNDEQLTLAAAIVRFVLSEHAKRGK